MYIRNIYYLPIYNTSTIEDHDRVKSKTGKRSRYIPMENIRGIGCHAYPMHSSGSESQSVLHMNLSQDSHPMGGVLATSLSNPRTVQISTNDSNAGKAAILHMKLLQISKRKIKKHILEVCLALSMERDYF